MTNKALDRPGRRVAEGADRMALDLRVTSTSMSISSTRASPRTRRCITRYIQPVPSRQGVHWPQLSCM